ncbi:MAG: sodium/proline symporter [Simkaniaceae bacterium]
MLTYELIAVILYVFLLFSIAALSYKRHQSSKDFILGGRSLNFWLIAMAAHSSDMSSWLLMGYPAMVFTQGLFHAWSAVGLIIFMFLNWQLIAPKIRVASERYGALTFSSFFESRFSDTSGLIRISTALMQLLFYSFYITAGLVSMGLLIHQLFSIHYHLAITLSVLIIIPYLFVGGFRTLAWTDFFQAMFMLTVVLITPIVAIKYLGGFSNTLTRIQATSFSLNFFPNPSVKTIKAILFLSTSWGLGYFGQPHIVTKFMGIDHPKNIRKSKYFGMSWQVLIFFFTTLIAVVGAGFFPEGLPDTQLIFVDIARSIFYPIVGAFVICAILAATISTLDSQILVLSSSLTEDLYKKIFRKKASSRELLLVSRAAILLTALLSFTLAWFNNRPIYALVEYAWFGLGASFGPLMLASLYAKKVTKEGALAGIVTGGTVAALWPKIEAVTGLYAPTLIPGFFFSLIAIFFTSWCMNLAPKKALVEK